MKIYDIDLGSLLSKGNVVTGIIDNTLHITEGIRTFIETVNTLI